MSGFYEISNPDGSVEVYQCPECGYRDTGANARAEGECERCGAEVEDEGGAAA